MLKTTFKLLLVFFCYSSFAQTTMSIGDIVFNTTNTSGTEDSFSFIPLVNIETGTVIYFTDKEWDADNTILTQDETVISWVATQPVIAGASIELSSINTTPVSNVGLVSGNMDLSLSDNIFIFQGNVTSPNFLYVFSTKNIMLPAALTSFTSLVQGTVLSGMKNFQYNCNVTQATKAQLFSLFSSGEYFNSNLNAPFNFAQNCDVTVTDNEEVDTDNPIILATLPLDNATEVSIDTDIQLVFNENILSGIGTVILKNSKDDSVIEAFNFTSAGVPPSGVTILEQTVTISFTEDLIANNSYYLVIGNNVFGDNALNTFEGITDKTIFNFSTIKDLPEIVSNQPNSEEVALSENIVIVFDREIQLVPNTEETIKVGDITLLLTDLQISIIDKTLTINLNEDFEHGTSYSVEIPNNAIQGFNDGVFEGTSYSFSTVCGPDEEKVDGFAGCLDKCEEGVERDPVTGECILYYSEVIIPDSELAAILEEMGYYDIAKDELKNQGDLVKLSIPSSKIRSLKGLSFFWNLKYLECQDNLIDSFNAAGSEGHYLPSLPPSLEFLNCSNNRIEKIGGEEIKKLKWLNCSNNNIQELNLANLDSLRGIDCSNNNLTYLDIKNGYNDKFNVEEYMKITGHNQNKVDDLGVLAFNAKGNSNLFCVVVDNPKTSLDKWGDYVDDFTFTNFTRINCDKVVIDDPAFEEFLINKKIDNVLDGYVLASNMGCVEELIINQEEHHITELMLSTYFLNLKRLEIKYIERNDFQSTIQKIHIEELPKLDTLYISGLGNLNSLIIDAPEITKLNIIDVSYSNDSLFKNLTKLKELGLGDVESGTSIDLSKNVLLERLEIYTSKLIDLDLTNNIELKEIYLSNTPISSINLENALNLVNIEFTDLGLTALDLSENKKLINVSINKTDRYIEQSNFSYLNTSGLVELESLQLIGLNGLSNIDITTNTSLKSLSVTGTTLTSLNVNNNISLNVIRAKGTNLSTIDLSSNVWLRSLSIDLDKISLVHNNRLEYLDISECQINSLNLDSNPLLETLNANNTLLNSIDISKNNNLITLNLTDTPLGSIDVSNNSRLKYLYLSNTKMSSLDITNCMYLSDLDISNNLISELKTHKNKSLHDFNFSNNTITELDLKMNVNLYSLYGASNNLTSLDLSKNKNLKHLSLSNNQLHTLNLKSGNNKKQIHEGTTGIQTINLTNNDLTCVVVDNYIHSAANWFDYIDEGVDFIEDETCGEHKYVTVSDENFEQALIDLGYDDVLDQTIIHQNVEQVSNLDVSNKDIKDLTGIEAFSRLETLYANNNLLTSFDFSYLPNLVDISIANNQLTSVNIPQFSNLLRNINLSKNEFETLTFLGQNILSSYYYFDSFNVEDNNNLNCINVSFPSYFGSNTTKDEHTLLSKSCSTEEFKKIAIEDENFEQALVDLNYDDIVDGFVVNDSIIKIKTLDISNKNINDLRGINHFVTLRSLNTEGNNLESIDVSALVRLDSLNCSNNNIKEVNLYNSSDSSSNEGLLNLNCEQNKIEMIDFGAITLIEKIKASNNLLSVVDLSFNKELDSLNISNNNLRMLNLKNGRNDSISYVNIKDNLEELICVWVDSAAYSTEHWTLKDENVVYSEEQCGTLTYFNDDVFEGVYDTYINGKVATEKIETVVTISFNSYSSVTDLTGLVDFISLNKISLNGLISDTIDFTDNMYVEKLEIINCQNLDSIDISGLTNLKELTITNNDQLLKLDLSNNTKLVSVDVTGNRLLEELKLDEQSELSYVSVVCNNLKELDLTKLTALESVYGFENDLEGFNIKNGNNTNIKDFYFTENENLYCIEVDDAIYSTSNWLQVDESVSYNGDCYATLNTDTFLEDENINIYIKNGSFISTDNVKYLDVFNVYGQQIMNKDIQTGMYIVKLINEHGILSTHKILVK